MARRPRIHAPGALYHVITRGNRRQGIFLDDRDLERFLTYLTESKERYSFCLYAYALMRNHLHLLLEVGEVSLSRIMQSLLSRYGRYFNMRHGEVGHLLQGRYKAIVCDKDAYLLELVRYIHLNPVRAKIVEVPEDYEWSGHLSYLGKARENPIGSFGERQSTGEEGKLDENEIDRREEKEIPNFRCLTPHPPYRALPKVFLSGLYNEHFPGCYFDKKHA